MASLASWLVPTIGGLVSGGGLVAVVNALSNRSINKVDVTTRLSEGILKWVEEFQEESVIARAEASKAREEMAKAREEAAEARRETAELRREVAVIMAESKILAERHRRVVYAILHPHASIEQLRLMVTEYENGKQR